jgi:hypothetical protein
VLNLFSLVPMLFMPVRASSNNYPSHVGIQTLMLLMLTGVLCSTKEGRPNIFSSCVSPRLDVPWCVVCDKVFTR